MYHKNTFHSVRLIKQKCITVPFHVQSVPSFVMFSVGGLVFEFCFFCAGLRRSGTDSDMLGFL